MSIFTSDHKSWDRKNLLISTSIALNTPGCNWLFCFLQTSLMVLLMCCWAFRMSLCRCFTALKTSKWSISIFVQEIKRVKEKGSGKVNQKMCPRDLCVLLVILQACTAKIEGERSMECAGKTGERVKSKSFPTAPSHDEIWQLVECRQVLLTQLWPRKAHTVCDFAVTQMSVQHKALCLGLNFGQRGMKIRRPPHFTPDPINRPGTMASWGGFWETLQWHVELIFSRALCHWITLARAQLCIFAPCRHPHGVFAGTKGMWCSHGKGSISTQEESLPPLRFYYNFFFLNRNFT